MDMGGLVNPNLLSGGAIPDYMGALQQGRDMRQKNIDYKTRNEDEARKDAARNAFQKAAQGQDITTPEGMKTAITGLAQAGFADEAARVYEAHKELFQRTPNSFKNIETDQGNLPFNEQTGKYGDPLTVNGQPVYSPAIAEKKKTAEADFNFGKSIPSYDALLKGVGGDMTKRDLLASKIMAEHPDSPKAEKYITTVIKTQSPFAITATPPSKNETDKWVDFLGNKGDYATFMSGMGGIRGPARQKALIDILAQTKAKYPDFDVVGAKAGIKQAEDTTNNKVLNLINGVLPNMQNLIALSDKIQRSGVKVVSRAQLEASRQFSDQDLANFDVMKNLTADEINQIFAGGKGGSDMSRHMALDLINETLPPQRFASTMKTIYGAMQNRANGIKQGFHGYGGASVQPTAAETKPHPQDSEAVNWAKKNPKDPRSAAILKANGL